MNLVGIAEEAAGVIRNASLRNLYQRDFIAWQSDILGLRTYKMMEDIANTALFGEIPRTAIKSSNGTSKTYTVSSMISWTASAFEPGDTFSYVLAPSGGQLKGGVFKYLKSFRQKAAERGQDLPGWINEQLAWVYKTPQGNIELVSGRSPAKGREVDTIQGVRSEKGNTFVFADEAGGLPRAIYTAAEAVLTGKGARGVFIGNPDNPEAEWKRIFTDDRYAGEYNTFTISSFDLPTFTGELVYPDNPDMQQQMMESLTQVSWVEARKRIWGENDARYLSKVLGQFPESGGKGFFGQNVIDKAYDTEIDDPDAPIVLGVDIARYGSDSNVIAVNQGGRIRVEKTWGKTDTYTTSHKIHDFANEVGAVEVRIDATGVGGGVADNLLQNPEFSNAAYEVVEWDNGTAAPDNSKHLNKRAYSHDDIRTQMAEGLIDLDYEDDELREQLQIVTYGFTPRGAIKITPKDELRSDMTGNSPDRLDAVIMAGTDMSPWTGNPLNDLRPGEKIIADPYDMLEYEYQYGVTPGTPL